jgi:hypothetical protein
MGLERGLKIKGRTWTGGVGERNAEEGIGTYKEMIGECRKFCSQELHDVCASVNIILHGAESFLRSYNVLSYSRNSPHFMEPEGS